MLSNILISGLAAQPPGGAAPLARIHMARRKNSRGERPRPAGGLGKEAVVDLLGGMRQQGMRAVRFLPVSVWPEHALFVGAKDAHLKRLTGGAFPVPGGQLLSTHPIFVLEKTGSLAHRVCPCSSQCFFNRRFITQGCALEHTCYVMAERTYLVEECVFQVPKDSGFLWSLRYWGKVPECCIQEEWPEGSSDDS
jgi:hypothetical protein